MMEGHALSWPQIKSDATERVPPEMVLIGDEQINI
jgi:hypothetical protein